MRHPKKRSNNRKIYFGKKKRHIRKDLAMAGADKCIGYLSLGFWGARHDKCLADWTGVIARIPPEVEVFTDSGFQGIRRPTCR